MESLFHGVPFPEIEQYIDCGGVVVHVDEPGQFIRFAYEQEPNDATYLYDQTFTAELGRVNRAYLQVITDSDGHSALEAVVQHRQPMQTPMGFGDVYSLELLRRAAIPDYQLQRKKTGAMYDTLCYSANNTEVLIESVRGRAPNLERLCDVNSSNNALRITMEFDTVTYESHLMEVLRLWGHSIDILSTFPTGQHMYRDPCYVISLQHVQTTPEAIDVMAWLEAYVENASRSGTTVPSVNYTMLDLVTIATEAGGDHELFSAALSGVALRSSIIYGKTGIMPPLSTESMVESLRAASDGAAY